MIIEVGEYKKKILNTITILGVQLPVSEKVFYPKKTEVVLSYISAMKAGKEEVKKVLKNI